MDATTRLYKAIAACGFKHIINIDIERKDNFKSNDQVLDNHKAQFFNKFAKHELSCLKLL
jgi:HD-like signal output (HDOD) protein